MTSTATSTLSMQAAPPSISAVPAPLLQRSCACGESAGPSEVCAECAEEELLGQEGVQAKLSISAPDDPYEREADAVADQVMRQGEVQGFVRGSSSMVQRSVNAESPLASVPEVPSLSGSAGTALSSDARDFFEPRFGRKLDHVRVHDDATSDRAAKSMGARAFTHGSNIYFANGEFDTSSTRGRSLMAHELTHVFQQGAGTTLRRQAASAAPPAQQSTSAQAEGSGSLQEIRPAPAATVTGITMACADMRMRVETTTTHYYYRMETCSLPLGDFSTGVTVTDNDFNLNFGSAASTDQRFDFSYRVEPGQTNPARLLTEQSTVDVHVVEHLPAPRSREERVRERPREPECVVRLRDRELIPRNSYSRKLFDPIIVPPKTIWAHEIPLGWFGWGEVSATVSANVNGQFNASYGPGMLTDICLTHLVDQSEASAPIHHPLLGPGSHTDSSVWGVGGRARFNFPARASVNVRAVGRLRVAGEWLSLIEVAAAEGRLEATGSATLSGSINGSVDILARYARDRATLEDPVLPVSVVIENSRLEGIDLTAAIGLRGRAALSFRLDAGAGFSVLGHDLWSQSWQLANFNTGVGWQGGLVYSPNPGLHFDLGEFGSTSETGHGDALEAAESLDDVELHEDNAAFDADTVLPDIFEDDEAQVQAPRGTPDDPLPFEWRKPSDLYPLQIDLPNADAPPSIRRDDGPTHVSWHERGRLQEEEIGVADWPYVGATFDYYPYDAGSRRTPEQAHFNNVLDRLGFDRSGLDAEHVWDVKLRGLEYDRFDNLWPASNQDQQLAGGQHARQIRDYERRLGSVAGLHFEIVNVKHPAR